MATAESLTMSPREHHQTYFGLPVHDGKVLFSEIEKREFFPRWQALMAHITTKPMQYGDEFVLLSDVKRFAQLYALKL